ncbi:MAG: GAF domain-containing protein [Chloroflexi bacterium]|nr:GAF domain-containing protein [Chloroflexota bacterium]
MFKSTKSILVIINIFNLVLIGQFSIIAPRLSGISQEIIPQILSFKIGLLLIAIGFVHAYAFFFQRSKKFQTFTFFLIVVFFLWLTTLFSIAGYTLETVISSAFFLLNLGRMIIITKPEFRRYEVFWRDISKLLFTAGAGVLLLLNFQDTPNFQIGSREIYNSSVLGGLFLIAAMIISLRYLPGNNYGSWLTNYSPFILSMPWVVLSTQHILTLNWMSLLLSLSMTLINLSPKLISLTKKESDYSKNNNWRRLFLASVGLYIVVLGISYWSLQQTEGMLNSAALLTDDIGFLELLEQFEDYREILFTNISILVILFPTLAFVYLAAKSKWLQRKNLPGISTRQPATEPDSLNDPSSHAEKQRSIRLTILGELVHQLDDIIDPQSAAQIAANAINRLFKNCQTTIFGFRKFSEELHPLATVGKDLKIQSDSVNPDIKTGLIGQAVRKAKTQLVFDTLDDPVYIPVPEDETRSKIVAPLFQNGSLFGVIDVSNASPNSFTKLDVGTIEAVAEQLMASWERTSYQQRLTQLLQAGVNLSSTVPIEALFEITKTTCNSLEAEFCFAVLLDQNEQLTQFASWGQAPKLEAALINHIPNHSLLLEVLNRTKPFRIPEIHKDPLGKKLNLDSESLRSLIAFPITLHGVAIGIVVAFGKKEGNSFSGNDESLAKVINAQASSAMESSWLYQELQSNLNITSDLYEHSFRLTQAENLSLAVTAIVETARLIMQANESGLVVFTPDGEIKTQVVVDRNNEIINSTYPEDLVKIVMETGKENFSSPGEDTFIQCLPIQSSVHRYGVLWLVIDNSIGRNTRRAAHLNTFTNHAAIALDRSTLIEETRNQALELATAYGELEAVYDQTLIALTAALDARDNQTEGHSLRVAQIAKTLGREIGLDSEQIKALERGALMHDIGKIGISDTILLKPGPLDSHEWEIMRLHPEIGGRIVEGIPFFQKALPVIRSHHERWNGTGYPLGLTGETIPLLARIFAVADAYDALTSQRPYRGRLSSDDSIGYLKEQAGVLFDPEVVNTFEKISGKINLTVPS